MFLLFFRTKSSNSYEILYYFGDTAFNHRNYLRCRRRRWFSKREKGSAALSGVLGFIVLHSVLNFLLVQSNGGPPASYPALAKLAAANAD